MRNHRARILVLSALMTSVGVLGAGNTGAKPLGCVDFNDNDKAIKALAKSRGHTAGDVRVLNRCAFPITLLVHASDVLGTREEDSPGVCIANDLSPNSTLVVRSRSKRQTPGLDPRVPRFAPVLCGGSAAAKDSCECAPGAAKLEVPEPSPTR